MDRQRVATCIALLEEQYGIPHPEERDPVDLLVMTILSQNTSDTNSLRAFALLKSDFAAMRRSSLHRKRLWRTAFARAAWRI